jgi:hypothetical protein
MLNVSHGLFFTEMTSTVSELLSRISRAICVALEDLNRITPTATIIVNHRGHGNICAITAVRIPAMPFFPSPPRTTCSCTALNYSSTFSCYDDVITAEMSP